MVKLLLIILFSGVSNKSIPISMVGVRFDPLKDGEPAIPAALKAEEKGTCLYIVQFKGPIRQEWKEALKDKGVEVYGYIPYYAVFARMDADKKKEILSLPFVRWVGLFHPYYKISPKILKSEPMKESRGTLVKGKGWQQYEDPLYVNAPNLKSYVLYGLPYVDWSSVASQVMGLGGEVKKVTGVFPGRMIIWVSPSVINDLAKIGGIYYIQPYYPKTLWNNTTKYVVQSYILTVGSDDWPDISADTVIAGALPVWDHNIKGQKQIVTVMDTGVDYYSCWFVDPEGDPPGPNHIVILDYEDAGGDLLDDDNCGHGTHVTGTVAGDPTRGTGGVGEPGFDYAGNAYMSKIIMQDIGYYTGQTCALNITSFYNAVVDSAIPLGSKIHTNSWGYSASGGDYSNEALDIDAICFQYQDFLFTVAAGNDGPANNTVSPPSTAKDCISVGSTYRHSYDATADTLSGFSSRGPTDDDRFKPDLTAPGGRYKDAATGNYRGDWREFILSAYPDTAGDWPEYSCRSAGMMGTSMATPAMAAAAALVRQYYEKGFYPSGDSSATDSFNPSGALVKATLIVSAEDMTADSAGVNYPIPNFEEGFGRVKLDSALYFFGDVNKLLVQDVAGVLGVGGPNNPAGAGTPRALTTGQADTFKIYVNSSLRPFRIALVWHDTAAAALANPTLINDLDLIVIDSATGTEYHGNDMTNGESNPNSTTFDRLNTVELFQLSLPSIGTWYVIISAFQVATSAPQPYAFAATGDIQWRILGIKEAVVFAEVKPDGILLRWNGSENVLYRIEKRSDGNKNFVEIAKTTRTEYLDKNVRDGVTYEYRVFRGTKLIGSLKVTFKGLKTQLYAPKPSFLKAGEKIQISYTLARDAFVVFKVYNTAGRLVRTIAVGKQKRGFHSIDFDGRDNKGRLLPPGKYFYRMFAGNVTKQKHFVIVE